MTRLIKAEQSSWQFPPEFSAAGLRKNLVYECSKRDMAVLLYDFREVRMGSEYMRIALFKTKQKPSVVLNEPLIEAWFDAHTIFLDTSERFLIFRREISADGKISFPILVLDLVNESFTCMPMSHGLDYRVRDENGKLLLRRTGPLRGTRDFEGVEIDPAHLRWYPYSQAIDLLRLNFDELSTS